MRGVLRPFLPFPGSEAVSRWERKCGLHSQSRDSSGRHPPCSLCLCFSSLFWRHARDLAFAPFPCTIVRISWVLFQSSLSCFHRHLLTFLELLQAHPATPARAKDLLRRRKAAPTAAPFLWYDSDTACIICEDSIMRSFLHLYLLNHGANEDFFFSPVETGIPMFDILLRGKKKVWNYKKALVSRNIKTELWFIRFSMAHFDTEKDKFCFSLNRKEKKMFTKSHAPKVERYQQLYALCYMKNSQQRNYSKSGKKCWPMPSGKEEDIKHLPWEGWWKCMATRKQETPHASFIHSMKPSSISTSFLDNVVKWDITPCRGPQNPREMYELSLVLLDFPAFSRVAIES